MVNATTDMYNLIYAPRISESDFLKLLSMIKKIQKYIEKSKKEFSGKNFSNFKDKLSSLLVEKIEPISKEIKRLLNEEKHLDEILLEGAEKANEFASRKVKEMKKIIGF